MNGIYYKIQQIALFSCFGLSNTIISLLSFNVGLNDKERIQEIAKIISGEKITEHAIKHAEEMIKFSQE